MSIHTVVEGIYSQAIRWQTKTFYANGRYWLFYRTVYGDIGNNAGSDYFTSSTDGTTWASPTLLQNNLEEYEGENIQAIYHNSEVFAFSRYFGVSRTAIHLNVGTLNADGTISWITGWQSAWEAGDVFNADFQAIFDSNGYPWIIWGIGSAIATIVPYVNKSDSLTETWHTAAGYPVQLSTDAETTDTEIAALQNGKMVAIFTQAGNPLNARVYDGVSSWGNETQISTSSLFNQYPPGNEGWDRPFIVDSNNILHLVFLSTTNNLIYLERSSAGTWSNELVIASGVPNNASPAICWVNNTTSIFWINDTNNIYKSTSTDGVNWSTPQSAIYEPDGIPNTNDTGYGTRLNGFIQLENGYLGLTWIANDSGATPYAYKIRFSLLNEPSSGPGPLTSLTKTVKI